MIHIIVYLFQNKNPETHSNNKKLKSYNMSSVKLIWPRLKQYKATYLVVPYQIS